MGSLLGTPESLRGTRLGSMFFFVCNCFAKLLAVLAVKFLFVGHDAQAKILCIFILPIRYNMVIRDLCKDSFDSFLKLRETSLQNSV